MPTSPSPTASPQTFRQAKPFQGLMMLIIACALMVAAPLSIFAVLMVGRQASASESWPSVTGQIVHSDVRQFNAGTTEKYKAEVRYTYAVDGRPYTGTRIRFMDTTGSAEHRQRKLIEPFPQGRQVPVYYDPADPSSSILIPGSGRAKWLFYAIPLILAGVGVYLFLVQRSAYQPTGEN